MDDRFKMQSMKSITKLVRLSPALSGIEVKKVSGNLGPSIIIAGFALMKQVSDSTYICRNLRSEQFTVEFLILTYSSVGNKCCILTISARLLCSIIKCLTWKVRELLGFGSSVMPLHIITASSSMQAQL